MKIAILLYPHMTALDAIGPYEVLSRLPRATIQWVSAAPGPVRTDAGLALIADYGLDQVVRPDVVLVPGGLEANAIGDPRILAWLQQVHRTSRYTTSVCTGSLVLGAAGLLHGAPATSHWAVLPRLAQYGARPTRRRVVQHGKLVTAAGVSAGIDMALFLAEQLAGPAVAQIVQLALEYDPQPPQRAGSITTAAPWIRLAARLGIARYRRRPLHPPQIGGVY